MAGFILLHLPLESALYWIYQDERYNLLNELTIAAMVQLGRFILQDHPCSCGCVLPILLKLPEFIIRNSMLRKCSFHSRIMALNWI